MHESIQQNSNSLQHALSYTVTHAVMLAWYFKQHASVKSCTFCKETRDIVGQVPVTECEAQGVDGMYSSPGFLLRLITCYPQQLPHTYAITKVYVRAV